LITIEQLMTDEQLLGKHFKNESWDKWKALLKGFYGLELTEQELIAYTAITDRTTAPQKAHDELWLAVGRRGGKSQISALLAVYEAGFKDHASNLSAGEVATILCISADRKQARTVLRYISGLLHSNPMLEQLIEREDKESIMLTNRTCIEIGTASFRSIRGYTVAAVICDEIAFWRSDESANPDKEIITALRPSLATLNGKLIALSSPYAKRGELWKNYRRYFGQCDESVLVAQASTKQMNPCIPDRVIRQAKEQDLQAALAEYEAQFRSDISSFVDAEILNKLCRSEPLTLPPVHNTKYFAFVDPSGGGADGFTLCIGHIEKHGRVVIDYLTERVRISPELVVLDYSKILNQYNVTSVIGDKYAGYWVKQAFEKSRITYIFSTMNRSEIYLEALALLNTGNIELPPDEKLIYQFQNLERRTSRNGKDSIDHPRGLHDDLANAVAGLIAISQTQLISPLTLRVKYAY
jgi:hypothetical protein